MKNKKGEGRLAQKGDRVVYHSQTLLNKGGEVGIQAEQVKYLPDELIRVVDGVTVIEHKPGWGAVRSSQGLGMPSWA